jgi:hypothetical protein
MLGGLSLMKEEGGGISGEGRTGPRESMVTNNIANCGCPMLGAGLVSGALFHYHELAGGNRTGAAPGIWRRGRGKQCADIKRQLCGPIGQVLYQNRSGATNLSLISFSAFGGKHAHPLRR